MDGYMRGGVMVCVKDSPGAPSVFFPQEGRREGCDHSTRSNRNTWKGQWVLVGVFLLVGGSVGWRDRGGVSGWVGRVSEC